MELALDDKPVLKLTSVQEGSLPASVGADSFLPNGLRKLLGASTSEFRYARDSYLLTAIEASKERFDCFAALRNVELEPQLPSRLLFRCDDDSIVARTLRWFDDSKLGDEIRDEPGWPVAGKAKANYHPQEPEKPATLDGMYVTAFRDYLQCPYRFYLRHVLQLKTAHEARSEMDYRAFGSLIHEALENFGKSELRDCEDEREIEEFLQKEVYKIVVRNFDDPQLPTLQMQQQQARIRLRAFARWQTEQCTKQGWKIRFVEQNFREENAFALEVDEKPFRLMGKIDRIDFCERTETWRIVDYKTSNVGKTPEQAHREKDGSWIDLQLPLYRHMIRSLNLEGNLELGYISLPKVSKKTAWSKADWTPEDLHTADLFGLRRDPQH